MRFFSKILALCRAIFQKSSLSTTLRLTLKQLSNLVTRVTLCNNFLQHFVILSHFIIPFIFCKSHLIIIFCLFLEYLKIGPEPKD